MISFWANAQQAKRYTIEDITVTGVNHLSAKTIISVSGLQIGDQISIPGNELGAAVRNIWGENIVGNVSIETTEIGETGIGLNIILTERSRLSSIVLYGIKKKEEKELSEKFNFVASQVLSEPLKKNIKLNIERYFKEDGFYNVQVSEPVAKADTSLENHLTLYYDVVKGEKLKINELQIIGANKVDEDLIRRKLKKTKEKKWWRVWHRSKYLEAEWEADRESVINHYHSLGMRDVTVELDSIYNYDEKSLNLRVVIDEGITYYFRSVDWVGNSVYSDKQLNKILGVKKGDIYSKSELDSKLNFNPTGIDVSSLYLDDGYLFFSATPVELRVDNDSIDLEMRIYEGQQAIIGEVRTYGNTKTSDHVLIRELYTLPGNLFSRSDLIRSQQMIARLGYFDPEKIGIVPIPNMKDGTVDIEYTVVEKPSDQLQLSGGWGGGGQIKFVGTLGVVFSNFSLRNILNPSSWDPLPSGDGQRLSIQAQANGNFYQNYSVSFSEPWLGGKRPNNLTVSLNHSLYGRYTGDGSMSISGASVSLGRMLRKIDDRMSLSNALSFYHYNIDNYSFGTTADVLCTECSANNFSLTSTLARRSAGPNVQFPTSGTDVTLSVALTPPYSLFNPDRVNLDKPDNFKLVEYHKWMFDFSSFMKLSKTRRQEGLTLGGGKKERPLVLHTRFHFGYIGTYNPKMDVGPFERFRMGGTGINGFNFILGTEIISLRGYTQDALFPNNEGGIIYDKAVFELRYPVVTEGMATIYGFGFFEAGNNSADYKTFNPLDLKRSVGFGASLFMAAIGNISFGYGWGLDPTPATAAGAATNGGNFLFSIGASIR